MHLVDRGAGSGIAQDMLRGNREIPGDPANHLLAGAAALLLCAGEQPCQMVRLVGQIAENVYPASGSGIEGGKLHTRDDGQTISSAQNLGAGDAGQGVVVGQGKRIQSGALGVKDNILQTGGTIGEFTVTMQVANHNPCSSLYRKKRKNEGGFTGFIIP